MNLDSRDLNITGFLKIENLKQAMLDLKPCRPERFRQALDNIDYNKIIKSLEKPVILKEGETNGIVYWRNVGFKNKVFSYEFAILFPAIQINNSNFDDFPIEIFFRGTIYRECIPQFQSLIDQITGQLILANKA